ncbi:MAG: hypothetical protein JNG88_15065 [Phycisphaerales bacterium]|nr:hypothetical protein [Phycisphaerales bacterium]
MISLFAQALLADDPLVGVRVLGGREYLQCERIAIPEIDDSSRTISEAAGRLSIAYRAIFGPPGDVHWRIEFRQYDEWNQPTIAPLDVDPTTSEFAARPSVGSFGEYACVTWNKSGATRARVFDGSGAPVTEPFVVTDNVQNTYTIPHILMDSNRIVFTLSARIAGQVGIFVRVFGYDGMPITALIPVAVSAAGTPRQYGCADWLSDGGFAVNFSRGSGNPDPSYVFFSIVSSSYAVGVPIQVNYTSAWCHGFGVLEGDEIGLIIKTLDESESTTINRYDLAGAPRDEPIDLDSAGLIYRSHIERNGVVALPYRVENDLFVAGRVLEPDWESPSEQFYLPLYPTSPQDDFGTIQSSPGLIADNGDAWFTWDNSTFPRQAHLAVLKPLLRGDMNNDRAINNFDIDAFVFALSNLPDYAAAYNIPEDAAIIIGDINEDGVLNNFDIDPFVMLLAGE